MVTSFGNARFFLHVASLTSFLMRPTAFFEGSMRGTFCLSGDSLYRWVNPRKVKPSCGASRILVFSGLRASPRLSTRPPFCHMAYGHYFCTTLKIVGISDEPRHLHGSVEGIKVDVCKEGRNHPPWACLFVAFIRPLTVSSSSAGAFSHILMSRRMFLSTILFSRGVE